MLNKDIKGMMNMEINVVIASGLEIEMVVMWGDHVAERGFQSKSSYFLWVGRFIVPYYIIKNS